MIVAARGGRDHQGRAAVSVADVDVDTFRQEIAGEFRLGEQDCGVQGGAAVLILSVRAEAGGKQRLHRVGDGGVAEYPRGEVGPVPARVPVPARGRGRRVLPTRRRRCLIRRCAVPCLYVRDEWHQGAGEQESRPHSGRRGHASDLLER
jgi:hypothetical protein